MKSRHFIVLAVLAAWVLLGPIGMAFDGCAAMGGMCEGPCGVSACALLVPVALTNGLEPAAYLGSPLVDQPPTATLASLEPPPKSLLPAA